MATLQPRFCKAPCYPEAPASLIMQVRASSRRLETSKKHAALPLWAVRLKSASKQHRECDSRPPSPSHIPSRPSPPLFSSSGMFASLLAQNAPINESKPQRNKVCDWSISDQICMGSMRNAPSRCQLFRPAVFPLSSTGTRCFLGSLSLSAPKCPPGYTQGVSRFTDRGAVFIPPIPSSLPGP